MYNSNGSWGWLDQAVPDIRAALDVRLGDIRDDLFDACCRVLGVEAEVAQDAQRVRPEKGEVMVLLSDPSRARELLGWEAMVSLEQGLQHLAAWLEKHQERFDSTRYHV